MRAKIAAALLALGVGWLDRTTEGQGAIPNQSSMVGEHRPNEQAVGGDSNGWHLGRSFPTTHGDGA